MNASHHSSNIRPPAAPPTSRLSYACEAGVGVPFIGTLVSVMNIFYHTMHAAKSLLIPSRYLRERPFSFRIKAAGNDLIRVILTPLGLLTMEARAICHVVRPTAKLQKIESFLEKVYGPLKL